MLPKKKLLWAQALAAFISGGF